MDGQMDWRGERDPYDFLLSGHCPLQPHKYSDSIEEPENYILRNADTSMASMASRDQSSPIYTMVVMTLYWFIR